MKTERKEGEIKDELYTASIVEKDQNYLSQTFFSLVISFSTTLVSSRRLRLLKNMITEGSESPITCLTGHLLTN